MPHFDHVRHGTPDLFAALNIATGEVIGKVTARHTAADFRDFLADSLRPDWTSMSSATTCWLTKHRPSGSGSWRILAAPCTSPPLLLLDQPGPVIGHTRLDQLRVADVQAVFDAFDDATR